MYILWARKRDKPEFEFITEFNSVNQKYYLVDMLDEDIYKEAIIVSEGGCELYVEFKQKVKEKKL